jgi:hypothetical protein
MKSIEEMKREFAQRKAEFDSDNFNMHLDHHEELAVKTGHSVKEIIFQNESVLLFLKEKYSFVVDNIIDHIF